MATDVEMVRTDAEPTAARGPLQTLDRGLWMLDLVSQHPAGLQIAQLADQLGVHRAIAYRLAATLEARHLIVRGNDGRLRLGAGMMVLASRFEPQLRTIALPVLRDLAARTRAAAFLSVPEGDECVAVMVAEPDRETLRVAYRVGSRHPLTKGAAGIAILAGRPVRASDPEPVRVARADGVAISRGQIQRGAVGVACPLHKPNAGGAGVEGCIGVVALDDLDTVAVGKAVQAATEALRRIIAGQVGGD